MKQGVSPLNINLHADLRYLELNGWVKEDHSLQAKALELITQVEGFFKVQKKKTEFQLMGMDASANINIYQELFPRIKLPSTKYARSDKKQVTDAFRWFFENHEYSWDTILKATAMYVDEYEKNTPKYLYMQTSQYFIRKQQPDKSWKSELANRCAEVDTGEEDEPENFSEKVV